MGQRREWSGRARQLKFLLSPFSPRIAANGAAHLTNSLHHKINQKFDPDQTFATAVSWCAQVSDARNFTVDLLTPEVASVSPSVRMIIELNIKHYRDLLKTETDASKRQTVSQLLSQEEAKLAKLLTQEDKDK
jgi:hypothetical protein